VNAFQKDRSVPAKQLPDLLHALGGDRRVDQVDRLPLQLLKGVFHRLTPGAIDVHEPVRAVHPVGAVAVGIDGPLEQQQLLLRLLTGGDVADQRHRPQVGPQPHHGDRDLHRERRAIPAPMHRLERYGRLLCPRRELRPVQLQADQRIDIQNAQTQQLVLRVAQLPARRRVHVQVAPVTIEQLETVAGLLH
jgi:hypothetical protein